MANPRHDLGLRAEASIATWLEQQGWRVLARRWRVSEGELDLVCCDPGDVLVGVEVRLRQSDRTGSGLESVGQDRVRRLRSALGRFAREHPNDGRRAGMRLDLVTLSPGEREGHWRAVRHPSIDAW